MISRPVRYAALPLVIAAVYAFAVRPWHLRWGATGEEMDQPLPGDELVPSPKYQTTHAVTVDAPASTVWPWIVQIGQGRGGFYSYDWLENLMDLDIHSASEISPDLQSLEAEDVISLTPDNSMPMTVVKLVPGRVLVLRTGTPDTPVQPGNYLRNEIAGSWAFILDPINDRTTRLIVRWRSDWQPGPLASLLNLLILELAHFVMERKMLLGIKARAERHGSQAPPVLAAT